MRDGNRTASRPHPAVLVFWNDRQRRLRALWRLLGMGVLLIVFAMPLGLLLGIATVVAPELLGSLTSGGFLAAAGAGTLIATLLAVWVAGRFLDRRRFADFGFRLSRAWWLDFGFGLALGALLMAGIFLVERAAGWLTVRGTFVTADPQQPFALAIVAPLLLFIAVGIYEELVSRGYLLRNLAEGLCIGPLGPRAALLLAWALSSALFGLGHASNPNATAVSTLSLMAAGLFLALGYLLTGELAIPIGLHISWNFAQGHIFGFPVSGQNLQSASVLAIEQGGPAAWTGGAFGPEAGLIGLLAVLLGSLLTLAWVRWRYGRIGLQLRLAEYAPARQAPAVDDTRRPEAAT